MGFYFTDQPPINTCFKITLTSFVVDIPAGATNHLVQDDYVLPVDVDVLAEGLAPAVQDQGGPAPGEWRGGIRTSRGCAHADPFHAGTGLGRGAVAEARV